MTLKTNPFAATVRESADDDMVVLELTGDIDGRAADALNSAYAIAVDRGRPRILLDFEKVHYINSVGIALIVGVLARARQDARKLFAGGLSDHYRQIFDLTKLSSFVTIIDGDESVIDTA